MLQALQFSEEVHFHVTMAVWCRMSSVMSTVEEAGVGGLHFLHFVNKASS